MEIVWILAVVYSDNIYVYSSFNMIDLNVFVYQNLKVQFQHQMALFVVPFIEGLIIFIVRKQKWIMNLALGYDCRRLLYNSPDKTF